MSALSTYDSPGTSTDSDLHSTGKRTTADLDIYYETTPDGGRVCRNIKERSQMVSKLIAKIRGHYSSKSKTTVLWAYATTCFHLGNRRNLSSGQRELFEPHLSTKAQDERLLKWIVDDLIPMSVVEVVSCKSFVNGINPKYVLPCRKTATRRIISTYSWRLQDMKSQLDSLDSKVSLTYDVWTSKPNLPYTSFTIHYIDSD